MKRAHFAHELTQRVFSLLSLAYAIFYYFETKVFHDDCWWTVILSHWQHQLAAVTHNYEIELIICIYQHEVTHFNIFPFKSGLVIDGRFLNIKFSSFNDRLCKEFIFVTTHFVMGCLTLFFAHDQKLEELAQHFELKSVVNTNFGPWYLFETNPW